MYINHPEDEENMPIICSTQKPFAFYSLILVLFIGLVALAISAFKPKTSIVAVEEISLVPEVISEQVETDKAIPGMHQYEALGNTYVLLTFGETCGYAMNVTPKTDESSVHFEVHADQVSSTEIKCEYKLFKVGAKAVSADENVLKNPGYGVGSEGLNIGWVQETSNGEYFITPILDPSPTDRVFRAEAEAPLSTGLYFYEYIIRSSGAYVTKAEKLGDYTCYATVGEVDAEVGKITLFFGTERVPLSVSVSDLNETDREYLAHAFETTTQARISLKETDGKPIIDHVVYSAVEPDTVSTPEITDNTENQEDNSNEEVQ